MSKFIAIKDFNGEEVIINVDSIAYFSMQMNMATDLKPYVDIHFIGEVDNKITFDIDYNEFKNLLGL